MRGRSTSMNLFDLYGSRKIVLSKTDGKDTEESFLLAQKMNAIKK